MSGLNAQWNFSVTLYAKDGVQKACLVLQDVGGVDVNILLVSLYLTIECRAASSPSDISDMNDCIASLRREVIHPLRRIRRSLRLLSNDENDSAVREIRSCILDAELRSELLEHRALADYRAGQPPGKSSNANYRQTIRSVTEFYVARSNAVGDRRAELEDAIRTLTNAVPRSSQPTTPAPEHARSRPHHPRACPSAGRDRSRCRRDREAAQPNDRRCRRPIVAARRKPAPAA
jgi:uncharacterized protein (TIGR02444 family)